MPRDYKHTDRQSKASERHPGSVAGRQGKWLVLGKAEARQCRSMGRQESPASCLRHCLSSSPVLLPSVPPLSFPGVRPVWALSLEANSLGIWAFTLTLLFSGCPVVSTQRRSPPAEMVLQAPPVQIFWLSPLSGEADSGGRERGKGERTGQGVRQYRPVGRRQEEMLHKSCKEEKSPCRVRVRAHSLMGNHRIIS